MANVWAAPEPSGDAGHGTIPSQAQAAIQAQRRFLYDDMLAGEMLGPSLGATQTKFTMIPALAIAERGPQLGAMRKLLSLAALVAGIWLIYAGRERQDSLAGKADASLSKLGEKIDGADHTPAHVKYYAAGAVLLVGGALGLLRR